MIDVKATLAEAEERMEEAVMFLEESLAHIRAGKANVKILDGIRVDSYGSMVPLNGVASVTTPDARTIAIKPWDKTMFKAKNCYSARICLTLKTAYNNALLIVKPESYWLRPRDNYRTFA